MKPDEQNETHFRKEMFPRPQPQPTAYIFIIPLSSSGDPLFKREAFAIAIRTR